ncbi:hypothetical protein, partial [Acinetobacter sp. NS4_7]
AFFFALGCKFGPKPAPITVTQVQHEVQIKTQDRVVTRTITVKERKPDGTSKETKTLEVAQTVDRTQAAAVRAAVPVAGVRANAASTWS